MRKFMMLVVIGIVIIGLCVPVLAQDVAGWGKTTWGMSREKVKGLYADRIDRVRDDGVIELNPVDMDGIPLGIRFAFDDDGKLNKVVMAYTSFERTERRVYVERFNKLRTLLVQKYGEPDVERDDSTPDGFIDIESLWFRGKTEISLHSNRFVLAIMYTPAKKLDDL